jgi:SHS2 domain-containing protein
VAYRYLDDIAIADVAFSAWGSDLVEVFLSACDATANAMVHDIGSISERVFRSVSLEAKSFELLLFFLLQELIYYKDAEQLLLRGKELTIRRDKGLCSLNGSLAGEKLDLLRHELIVDVKAATLHRLEVKETSSGWLAVVVLDV